MCSSLTDSNCVPCERTFVVLSQKGLIFLKCFYTNACSMRNQQEELEALSQSHKFDVIGVSPVSYTNGACWMVRRDREGRRGRGVGLCVIEG